MPLDDSDSEKVLLLFLRYSYFIQRFKLSFLNRIIRFVDMENEASLSLLKSKSLCLQLSYWRNLVMLLFEVNEIK